MLRNAAKYCYIYGAFSRAVLENSMQRQSVRRRAGGGERAICSASFGGRENMTLFLSPCTRIAIEAAFQMLQTKTSVRYPQSQANNGSDHRVNNRCSWLMLLPRTYLSFITVTSYNLCLSPSLFSFVFIRTSPLDLHVHLLIPPLVARTSAH